MDSILQQITDWLKEMLVSAIMGNLSGMFESVNNQVGEIATSVGMTPAKHLRVSDYPNSRLDSDLHCLL